MSARTSVVDDVTEIERPAGRGADAAPLPEHLIGLGDEPWALWRWTCLRGAGFPAAWAYTLAAPVCAAAADRILQAVAAAAQARARALGAVNAALDRLRSEQAWDDLARREPLLAALHGLKKGQTPSSAGCPPDVTGALAALRDALAEVRAAHKEFERTFEAGSLEAAQALHDLAQDSGFREALIWQNRRAFHSAIATLRRPAGPEDRSSKRRKNEELVASYVQRYCVKNDTIGFFGPVGWARFVARDAPLIVRPGPRLVASREVSFEQWGIDALAAALARSRWLRPWLAPRRLPYVYVSGTMLRLPDQPPARLSAGQALVLHACDGERSAREIAVELSRAHPFELRSETEVYTLLEQLCARGLIVWTLEVPFAHHPEQALRRRIERIGDERLRRPALESLATIEEARRAVADAASDAARLDQALSVLENRFTRATGEPATHAAGATYAARTLVYEDCRRDVEVEIGAPLLRELGPPLALLLASARWFTFEAAAGYRRAFERIYYDLAGASGSGEVDLLSFWQQAKMRTLGHNRKMLDDLTALLQERWAGALDLPAGQRRVAYRAADLRPRILAAFAAPRPGWQIARQHSPDVMIAAASAEDIARGEYQLVMGELHIGSNTLRGSFFIEQHPAPHELHAAFARDMAAPRVAAALPRNWPESTARTRPDFVNDNDFRLVFTNDICGIPPERALPIGDLVVVDSPAGPLIRARDGRHSFDLVEFFADILSHEVINCFELLRPREHTPRISIDRLVICRETWRFAPEAVRFTAEKTEAERFLAARRWAADHGMPRRVFVKTPAERKPFYVDFDSPILVNMLAKLARRSADRGSPDALIAMSEMLPTPDHAWLPDAEGRRYTSELRIIAVDLDV